MGTSAISRAEWVAVGKSLASFYEDGCTGLAVDLLYHFAPTPTGAAAPASSQNRRSEASSAIVGRVGKTT